MATLHPIDKSSNEVFFNFDR